jgi:hypothetical protein
MALPLKTAGLRELSKFKTRLMRQLALERVRRPDHDFIMEHLEAIEARIVEMEEVMDDDDYD